MAQVLAWSLVVLEKNRHSGPQLRLYSRSPSRSFLRPNSIQQKNTVISLDGTCGPFTPATGSDYRSKASGLGGVNGEPSFSDTPVGVDSISGDLAVRILRNPVAHDPCSSVAVDSGRRPASARWTDAEWSGDRRQRWNDASCGNALHPASSEPDVASCDIEDAAAISSRPSATGTVQHR